MIISLILMAMALVSIGVLVVLVFTYLLSSRQTTPERTHEDLREFGLRADSVSDDGDVLASGTIEGREVEVNLQRAPGGVPIPLLAVRVEFDDGGTGLRLRRQGTLDRYSGDTDLLVGDEEFDSKFILDSGVPPTLKTWLSSARQRLLIDHRSQFTRIEHRHIVLESSQWPRDGEVVRILGRLVEFAARLESAGGVPSAAEPAAPSAPNPAEEEQLAPRPPDPDTSEEPTHEADPGADLSTASADTVPDAAPSEELASHQETPVPERPPAEEVESTRMEALEPAALSADLFAEGIPGFEATERFEAGYQGREVCWTGTLSGVSSGEVELDLLALDPTSANPKLVRARCALSDGAAEGLRGSVGTAVTVRGTLAGCDPFLRILKLQDARPV